MVIIDKQSCVAVLAEEGVQLDRHGAQGRHWVNTSLTTRNARLIEQPLPGPFWPETWRWDGQQWQPLQVPLPLLQELRQRIEAERDRRIAQGMPYEFAPGRMGRVQLRDERDRANLIALGSWAALQLATGQPQATVSFRDADNVEHELTATQTAALAQAALQWVSAHYAAAWQHKRRIERLAEDKRLLDVLHYDLDELWP
ncbi:MAG: DUF4376 domain-containing protein [Rhodocyclaceae bacterium]|nr:DUF4376 domain-containing protein [Rhodocyclaceae bacterium]